MSNKYTIVLTVIVMLLFGCGKKETPPTVSPNYIAYLENKTSQKVIVDIYHTAVYPLGYDSFIKRVVVEPYSKIKIPGEQMIDGTTYTYDWYSEDYKLTNWMPRYQPVFLQTASTTGNIYQNRSFIYHGAHTGVETMYSEPSDERRICLGGNGKETVWKAVDAYDKNGVSVWDTLSPDRKNHKVVLTHNAALIDSNLAPVHQGVGPVFKTKFVLLPIIREWGFWLETDGNKPRIIMGNNFNSSERRVASLSTNATDTLFYCLYYPSGPDSTSPYIGPFYKMARIDIR